ncbi:MAG: hypothetical protein KA151_11685 [Piscinibacter sp.]|nr:hypothetical protein [Piscinibacter sp.]
MRQLKGSTIAALLAVAAGAAGAQTTVYESRDKAGPVFSDKPTAGSTPVTTSPPNVVSMPVPAQAPAPASAPAAAPYKSLVFVSLGDGGTIHSNTGAFEFSVRVVPALRATDRLRIQLDGRELPGRYRGTNLRVSEADWRSAARDDSAEHTLQVGIVDEQGKVLIVSGAISFFAHRATVGGGRR